MPHTIDQLNDLAMDLVARDYQAGIDPQQLGPTATSRALAIIHLAMHDAYAMLGLGLKGPQLAGLPPRPHGMQPGVVTGDIAMAGAARRTMLELYPASSAFIRKVIPTPLPGNRAAFMYGESVASAWLIARSDDNSNLPQLDSNYSDEAGRHRRDPTDSELKQQTLGRNWGIVAPFALSDVEKQTKLAPPPPLTSQAYADAFDDVYENGRGDLPDGDTADQHRAAIGIFWGYDGANGLGTPPRLYNQVIRATTEYKRAPAPYAMAKRVRYLAAINMAMAEAGIAAWYWKYVYDFWRPVVAIREADRGWGPGKHHGDGNTLRQQRGNPFWLPLGAPRSNPKSPPAKDHVTPNFPAYPSGHATFGSACFESFAKLAGKNPEEIRLKFVSDEFDGKTTDASGVVRPLWQQEFSLREAIEQNKISRIYLGVHWIFDATGGEELGKRIADVVAKKFQ